MKDFDWTQFTRKIAIEAPIETIYDAWTVPSELERWFLSKALFVSSEGNTRPASEHIITNDTYSWHWFLWEGTETGKVLETNGTNILAFSFIDSKVTVSLSSYKTGTIVSLHQENIPTTDEGKKNIRLGCDQGWSFYLVNLKSVYEGGLDLRNKNKALKNMLNT